MPVIEGLSFSPSTGSDDTIVGVGKMCVKNAHVTSLSYLFQVDDSLVVITSGASGAWQKVFHQRLLQLMRTILSVKVAYMGKNGFWMTALSLFVSPKNDNVPLLRTDPGISKNHLLAAVVDHRILTVAVVVAAAGIRMRRHNGPVILLMEPMDYEGWKSV
jgi:hypothetical protein